MPMPELTSTNPTTPPIEETLKPIFRAVLFSSSWEFAL